MGKGMIIVSLVGIAVSAGISIASLVLTEKSREKTAIISGYCSGKAMTGEKITEEDLSMFMNLFTKKK